jgi:hypothetical protein
MFCSEAVQSTIKKVPQIPKQKNVNSTKVVKYICIVSCNTEKLGQQNQIKIHENNLQMSCLQIKAWNKQKSRYLHWNGGCLWNLNIGKISRYKHHLNHTCEISNVTPYFFHFVVSIWKFILIMLPWNIVLNVTQLNNQITTGLFSYVD